MVQSIRPYNEVTPYRDHAAYNSTLPLVLLLFLLGLVAVVTFWLMQAGGSATPQQEALPQAPYLAAAVRSAPKAFRFSDVPSWLFLHVGVIAGVQVLALIGAAFRAGRIRGANDVKIVQFLVEIPMYLGLFGTLLGVCLTQFVTGALTAPMAYLTTMSGIVLHIIGKLVILLPLPLASTSSE